MSKTVESDRPKDSVPPPGEDADDAGERPTVIPDFDLAELARKLKDSSGAPRRATPLGLAEIPQDAYAVDASPGSSQQGAESTRTSLLSMADARTPSGDPDPSPSRAARSERPFPPEALSELDQMLQGLEVEDPVLGEAPTRTTGGSLEDAAEAPGSRRGRKKAPTGEHLFTKDTAQVQVIAGDREEARAMGTPPPGTAAAGTAAAGDAVVVPSSFEEKVRDMRDRFSLGDYTGALALTDELLQEAPDDLEVNACADNCRDVLRHMYVARIGPLDRVPVVIIARDQLRWMSIDHRAGFLLSHIDGVSSLEMILDVSGMPPLDALRILCELTQQRIISFR